jgi:hypothetical protein
MSYEDKESDYHYSLSLISSVLSSINIEILSTFKEILKRKFPVIYWPSITSLFKYVRHFRFSVCDQNARVY